MEPMRRAVSITVSEEDWAVLTQWARGRSTPVRLMQRAQIILRAAEGLENKAIAREVGLRRQTVGMWRNRFAEKTTREKPRNATHWTTRTLAKEMGLSQSMVLRVWQDHGLKPHLIERFKLSNDPRFVEKLVDVVGLYLNPPEHALVLSVDEKSQIQALDRTQPGLPIKKGRCGTMTHKHPRVESWLKRHPRFHMHFTPTSSSWLNLVERWFRELTDKRLRRGVFKSVPSLVEAIMDYIAGRNENPKPLVWTARVQHILAKVRRARAALNKVASA
jgi:transposase